MGLLERNLAALAAIAPRVSSAVSSARATGRYREIVFAKNGSPVPLFDTGFPAHSLYNPEKEAERTIDSLGQSVYPVFLGFGGGYAVRTFLERNRTDACAIVETDCGSLKSLFSLVDLTDILADNRVTLIPSLQGPGISRSLLGAYLPSLYGGLTVVPPSIHWMAPDDLRLREFAAVISETLRIVMADYSVQAHFGRLWLRNFWKNIRLASKGGALTAPDTGKRAIVIAAGPGMEDWLPTLAHERNDYCVFATDTAYSTLAKAGIVADYFVSIDAQHVSAYHGSQAFSKNTTVALELCGNPVLAEIACRSGSPLFFFAGNHPLSRFAADRFGFSRIETGSGTVTVAALGLAKALGFPSIQVAGADFAYTNGKPYARGTYLEDAYCLRASRLLPLEHQYTSLMFRTNVRRETDTTGKITYKTDILDSYAASCSQWEITNNSCLLVLSPFDYSEFHSAFLSELKEADSTETRNPLFYTVIPFVAWYRKTHPSPVSNSDVIRDSIQLALRLIAGYTGKS